MSTEHFSAVWPGGEIAIAFTPPAVRLSTLDGKRIAFLWDAMFRGDEIFPMLQQQLSEKFPAATFVSYAEFGSTFGGDEHAVLEALPQLLNDKGIDAVVSGNGC
jgi:hypothetical protein